MTNASGPSTAAAPARRAAGLQARLLLAVGGLALAAIGLVALAARHETRLEFLRFADGQRREESSRLPALAGRLGRELDGRCCAAIADVAAQLPADTALLVLDARGAVVATAGASTRVRDSCRGSPNRRRAGSRDHASQRTARRPDDAPVPAGADAAASRRRRGGLALRGAVADRERGTAGSRLLRRARPAPAGRGGRRRPARPGRDVGHRPRRHAAGRGAGGGDARPGGRGAGAARRPRRQPRDDRARRGVQHHGRRAAAAGDAAPRSGARRRPRAADAADRPALPAGSGHRRTGAGSGPGRARPARRRRAPHASRRRSAGAGAGRGPRAADAGAAGGAGRGDPRRCAHGRPRRRSAPVAGAALRRSPCRRIRIGCARSSSTC